MELTERVCAIVNPAAGRGRGRQMLGEIHAAFEEVGVEDILITAARGEERELASRAIALGFTTIVAVGGDGTTTNVANAILRAGRDTRLGVVSAGTGNDFAKTLGTSKSAIREIARLSTQHADTRVDVGRVEGTYFLNSCGFGFDVAVIEGVAQSKRLRGRAVYVWAALRELFRYSGIGLAVGRGKPGLHMMLVIANARYFGGAFTIAPGASVADGLLDSIAVSQVPLLRRISLLSAVARGTHLRFPEVKTERAALFDVEFLQPPSYEADGELRHARSARLSIDCVPGALRVLTAPGGATGSPA
ncbi:MAG: diacylglycerol kinase family protein [Gemmatimonadaceae bacterium]